ncbi:hypothetical protein EV426DRAFT_699177 [Tirmania nivea]|nr:hypothetical protein EV426DRAFT_699177 [Tirmania nivea]
MNPWNSPAGTGRGVAPEEAQSLEEHVRRTWAWVLSNRFGERPPAMMPQDPNMQLGLFNGPGLAGGTQHPEEVQQSTTLRPNIYDVNALHKALDKYGSRNQRNVLHDFGVYRQISNGTFEVVAPDNTSNHEIHIQARGPSTNPGTLPPTAALVECPHECYCDHPPSVQLSSFEDRNAPHNEALQQIFQVVENIVSLTPSQYTASTIQPQTLATGQRSVTALAMAKRSVRVKYGIQTENIMHASAAQARSTTPGEFDEPYDSP